MEAEKRKKEEKERQAAALKQKRKQSDPNPVSAKKKSKKKAAEVPGGGHVPYRESVLTLLLKDALFGNAKVTLMAAISPADNNYDETMSTLRFCLAAKKIQTKALVNEDPVRALPRSSVAWCAARRVVTPTPNPALAPPLSPLSPTTQTEKLIKGLREEIDNLKTSLQHAVSTGQSMTDAILQLKSNEAAVDSLAPSQNEKDSGMADLRESRAKSRRLVLLGFGDSGPSVAAMATVPQLRMLTGDPATSGTVIVFLRQGEQLRVGRDDTITEEQDLKLAGLGILAIHCVVEWSKEGGGGENDDVIAVTPSDARAAVYVNGVPVVAPGGAADGAARTKVLKHGDRLVLGPLSHVFVLVDPRHTKADDDQGSAAVPTYETAVRECLFRKAEGADDRRDRLSRYVERTRCCRCCYYYSPCCCYYYDTDNNNNYHH